MPDRDADALTIWYVVSRWGEPTQTFVRREAAAAVSSGNEVVVLTLKRPHESDWPYRVHHLSLPSILWGMVTATVRHPWRSTLALSRGLVRGRPHTIASNLAAAAVGVAADRRVPPVHWIHAHFNWVAGTAADALATVRGQRFSVFPHAFDIFDRRYVDRYTGDKLRRAALVLVESERIAEETNKLFRCGAIVQRMGVPPQTVVAQALPRTGSLVLSVGSLLPKKGHDDLIRAVASMPQVRLRILGEGPQRGELEQLAQALGAADRVDLRGAVTAESVFSHLDEATVFCLASKPTSDGDRDGVPNVLIEAMARGVPVVSTTVAGIPDLLADGRGTLVEPGEATGLGAELARLLEDPVAAAAQADRALRHVREHYTTAVNWTLLEDRIRSALESAGSPLGSHRTTTRRPRPPSRPG